MIEAKKTIKLTCSNCGAVLVLEATNKDDAFAAARKIGWAVSRNRKNCYCANCAPLFRYVGKNGTSRACVQTRFSGI